MRRSLFKRLGPGVAAVAALAVAACAPAAAPPATAPAATEITLYASVPAGTLDAVVAGFNRAQPSVKVSVFRNGTGPVTARVAAEQKAGRVQADVVWLAEPTAVQDWSREGLLLPWTPAEADAIPEAYRAADAWGTRLINVVIGYRTGAATPRPADWPDLANPAYRGKVGLPNPAFAGSTLGALGFFAFREGYGFPYYQRLNGNGAVQMQGNQEIADGIAQGRFDVGMTLDYMIRPMAAKGSPIEAVWPASGAIAVYSPIAVFQASRNPSGAKQFVEFTLSKQGQALLVEKGFEPIRPDVPWDGKPAGATAVSPDWSALLAAKADLLDQYSSIFPT